MLGGMLSPSASNAFFVTPGTLPTCRGMPHPRHLPMHAVSVALHSREGGCLTWNLAATSFEKAEAMAALGFGALAFGGGAGFGPGEGTAASLLAAGAGGSLSPAAASTPSVECAALPSTADSPWWQVHHGNWLNKSKALHAQHMCLL